MSVEVDETLVKTILCVHAFFQDEKKVALWMNTKNLNFGDCSPVHLFARQRGHKVLEFVNYALENNHEIQIKKPKKP